MKDIIVEFEGIIMDFPEQLAAIESELLCPKINPDKWSKKEILGHLIDSALINYSRCIQAQSEENPQIFYDQNEYCKSAFYADSETLQLRNLWTSLNQQLLFLFKQILKKDLGYRRCNDNSLEFLIHDYVAHLNHHRKQILK